MLTTLLNPTLWLLGALAVSAVRALAAGEEPRTAFARVVRMASTRGVLALLILAAAGGLVSRIVLGYLAPGAYAEEVIGARSYLAERQLYHGSDRADFAKWLSEEPAAADPWTLPGLTVCQANAIERRPQLYTSQGHSPVLLLASVPVVKIAGGRALYLAMVAASLLALAALFAVLACTIGVDVHSRSAMVLAVSIVGWQPTFAAVRQGDAALIVASLLVCAHWLVSKRPAASGAVTGVGAALLFPLSVVFVPLARISWRAFVLAVVTLMLALAATAALGGTMIFVDYLTSTIASARLYAASPITYSAAAKLLVASPSSAVTILASGSAIVVTTVVGWRPRQSPAVIDASLASFAALAFLLIPIAWSQHVTLLVLPLAALLVRALSSKRAGMLIVWTALALLLSMPDRTNLWIDVGVRALAGAATASLLPTVATMAAVLLWVSMLVL